MLQVHFSEISSRSQKRKKSYAIALELVSSKVIWRNYLNHPPIESRKQTPFVAVTNMKKCGNYFIETLVYLDLFIANANDCSQTGELLYPSRIFRKKT